MAPGAILCRIGRADVARSARATALARAAPCRIAYHPIERPVTIRWNEHQVPWVEAETDRDCAVVLGLIHAHLRLGHMEILRRVALGRTAEMLGPAAIDVDRILRTLSLTNAVPGIVAMMPDDTRRWLDGFTDGLNHYVAHATELPPDFTLLGLRPEPWTAADVIALGRAVAADVNWLIWFRLWGLRRDPAWPTLWARLLAHGGGTAATLVGFPAESVLDTLLASSRTGSNAWAVAAEASATGGALLACDPHLPIALPNPWLLAAYQCPSYHVAGLMLPGLPFVGVGRNPWIAWGGTAALAASSDVFDLSSLPDEPFVKRREVIRARGGRPVTIEVRTSRYGPVVSDALRMDGTYALRWVGHQPSDEITAMLGINRACSVEGFRAAGDLIAVPGENFVVAEAKGGIAKQIAVQLPRRPSTSVAQLTARPEDLAYWSDVATGRDFPSECDPGRGFVVSANDRPADTGVPLGFLFPPADRAERIAHVLARSRPVSMRHMFDLQRDVVMPSALPLRDRMLQLIEELPVGPKHVPRRERVAGLLRNWDGSYPKDSRGALAFELLVTHLSAHCHSPAERAFYAALWTGRAMLADDLCNTLRPELVTAMRRALIETDKGLDRYRSWGDIHRLVLLHPLATLPLIGGRLVFADLPVGGTSETVMKTAHADVPHSHRVLFGSVARFAADLSALDESFAVLLSGQDGWLGSDTMLDQFRLWREGRSIRLPLQPETAAREFPHVTRLEPRR